MFKAGFSRLDVTPPFGIDLAGYFERRLADGILDPIQLNAVAFSDGENTNVIIIADFLGMMEEFCTPIRKKISEGTGIPEDNIMLSSIHAHTSIRLGCPPWVFSVEDEEYLSVLYRKFVDAAKIAIDDLKPAKVFTATKETDRKIAFIRRYKMKDGSTRTNPGRRNPDIDHAIGEADNRVRLIRFVREGASDIALVNFSTHPDVIGGTKYSADWPGFVRRFVEDRLTNVSCLVLNGAQGDSNHINTAIAEVENGYGHSELMGRVITDTVLKIWDKGEEHPEGKVFSEVEIVMTKSNREGEEEKEYYTKMHLDHLNNGTEYPSDELGKARRIYTLDSTPLELKIPVTVMGFSDIAFVGFGGEPFMAYAERARRAAPGTYVVAACCSNGQQGYLPVESAFAEGGYEAKSSRFTPALPEDILSAAERMLRKYCK